MSASLKRESILQKLGSGGQYDVVIIGGGATGLGAAVDAAARGYRTVLVEAFDFAKGTSSRSTKLVHGGVRYLQQGNVKLVLEALLERGRMLRNAPHLAQRRSFIIPAYQWWEFPFYGVGLSLYDLLSGRESLGRSRILSRSRVLDELVSVRPERLKGGILYYDGQFDDARYAISLLRTLFEQGGIALNYAPVRGLLKRAGTVCGVEVEDSESGTRFEISAKAVINATGIFCDSIRRMDDEDASAILTVSQGSHIVLPREFLPSQSALMIPRTSDGRVLFAIPWHDRVVVGTTDDPVAQSDYEPRALPEERRFLIDHVTRYLGRRPEEREILSVWSGQRPLVKRSETTNTAQLSRDKTILVSTSKLVTITGGKWTTYRRMGEDVVDRAANVAGLPAKPSCTAELKLHGWTDSMAAQNEWERVYGSDLPLLANLANENADWNPPLHPRLPFRRAEVIWAARNEMARTVEDILARRTRALFLDARASREAASDVAALLAKETGRNELWQQEQTAAFDTIAEQYIWRDNDAN